MAAVLGGGLRPQGQQSKAGEGWDVQGPRIRQGLGRFAHNKYLIPFITYFDNLIFTKVVSCRICLVLLAIPYLYSTCILILITVKLFNLSFCNYVVNHFYCDNLHVLTLVCSNTQEVEFLILIFSAFNLVFTLLVVVVSYLLILIAILRMKSAEGRHKAFFTCGSHLTVVTVFYGTLIFMYVNPKSSHSFDTDKMASIFYTLIIPMLNPLIYSLRNKDIKCALQKMWTKVCNIFS
ncbi:olfactory receptor 8K3-like [Sorex araneus]|uniref:olfactory receptor 8K3-like n=1 Tax=Sorex araneus TaxID=42254 RepID=UPI002433C915|nr:olfactory receptor 8K3-like [Sorex araneus]